VQHGVDVHEQRAGFPVRRPFGKRAHPRVLALGAAEQERVVAHDTTSSSARRGRAVRVSFLRIRLGLRGAGRAAGSATPSGFFTGRFRITSE